MPNGRRGVIRLFRIAGIDVFLHWSWFLIAVFEIQSRARSYSSITWNVLEYLALFAIVLLHEFGHSLACRQVGGKANRIVLWPLGGVAFVDPPQRPGATLWSIVAGPLVNVALLPLLYAGYHFSRYQIGVSLNLYLWFQAILFINKVLLVFNLLPIYPLDGGQILRSLLWFVMGRARSLLVVTVLGFIGVAGFIVLGFWVHSPWYVFIAVFALMNCWSGLKHARMLLRVAKLPRREGFACPGCHSAPPQGDCWICGNCHEPFDIFEAPAVCPSCLARFTTSICLECGAAHPVGEWAVPSSAAKASIPASTT
jgi:Zn-dependent protease